MQILSTGHKKSAVALDSAFFIITFSVLHNVHEDEQAQPYDVHKVPIPGYAFEGEMVFWCKMAFPTAEQNDTQHGGTNANMKAVKASQHKKGRTVNACA